MGPTFYSALAAGMLQDLSSPLQCDQQDYYAPYSAMENGPMLEKAMDIFLSLAWERPTPFKMTWQSMFDDSSQDLLPDWTISQLAVAIAAEIAAERYRETTLMLLAHLRETMPSDTTTDPQTHHLRTWLHEMYPDRVSTVQPRYRGSRGKRAALTWERRKEIATRRHRKYALVSSPALTYRRRRDPHEHQAMVDALMLPLPVGNRSLRVVDVLANLVASTLSTSDLTTAPQTALQIASQEQSVMERASNHRHQQDLAHAELANGHSPMSFPALHSNLECGDRRRYEIFNEQNFNEHQMTQRSTGGDRTHQAKHQQPQRRSLVNSSTSTLLERQLSGPTTGSERPMDSWAASVVFAVMHEWTNHCVQLCCIIAYSCFRTMAASLQVLKGPTTMAGCIRLD